MLSKNSFRGAVALVTGASRGIGKALAVELGARGAKVACAARATNQNRFKISGTIDETVELIEEGRGLAVSTDLNSPADIEAMVATTVEHFGALDILVNNAAVTFPGDLQIASKHYELVMDINVRAPILATAASTPHLAKSQHGRILNVSSVAGLVYIPQMMAYGMSKAALDHFSVSSAAQLEAEKIAVNCFRIDTQVASEGYIMNAPDEDHSSWFSAEVTAQIMCWMLEQPADYTGKIEEMLDLGVRIGLLEDSQRSKRLETRWTINTLK